MKNHRNYTHLYKLNYFVENCVNKYTFKNINKKVFYNIFCDNILKQHVVLIVHNILCEFWAEVMNFITDIKFQEKYSCGATTTTYICMSRMHFYRRPVSDVPRNHIMLSGNEKAITVLNMELLFHTWTYFTFSLMLNTCELF